ncbi:ABC multidrug transporter [Sporothrix brasiliensis 5110]|uniref:ABC multidrug transporter n=1 Tax=Sporothrix brasiliensis 5110 TaxID=1398154 RepID=A0A0C2JBB5_9PEZI|nr:ABC multidrug transporter [Sporothrix brasiliensis 5110]KIH94142.1 ABC multidrug transporter [Sporothrix brasiliensis 5110]
MTANIDGAEPMAAPGHQNVTNLPPSAAPSGVVSHTPDTGVAQHRPDEIEEVDQILDSESVTSAQTNLTRSHTRTMIHEHDRDAIRRVATAMSFSGEHGQAGQTFTAGDDALNPNSPNFDISKWLGKFIRSMRGEGIDSARARPGIVFKNLSVSGSAPDLQVQQTVASTLLSSLSLPLRIGEAVGLRKSAPNKQILHKFNGVVAPGELLVVLGRPGSGCSTLLKSMCGELHGLHIDEGSTIHYSGIPQPKMVKEFRGETIYNQEVDKHFPELTVGQTLEFAAQVRMPSHKWSFVNPNMTRNQVAKYAAQVVMAVCGLSHTYNTKVGNEFVRGVSGGERKRVSIAEMMVVGSPFMAWDNSTRGLDSATALKFVQTLRIASDLARTCNAVAIYQASESIYELFDKATVLYEGRQIYFGPASGAKAYFEGLGYACPTRQTTGDFLTSVTNPVERKAKPGMEDKVPRTAEEFEACWLKSAEYEAMLAGVAEHEAAYPLDAHGQNVSAMREVKKEKQANHVRPKSPYIISTGMQIKLNTKREYQRLWNDKAPTITTAVTCIVLALIIGSIVYGTPDATAGFFSKSSALFMAVLLNALVTLTEINSLYAQRPIVEKHASYAFYHPATNAIAGVVADIPIKFIIATCFNIVLYFMAGLRREPAQFFIYFLFTYTATFTMSAIFRTMAAMTRTISQAMSLAGIVVLGLVMYTGFVITVPTMHPWFAWIRWINPIYYAFEALIANEFHGRQFVCSVIIPGYSPPIGNSWICNTVGSVAGQDFVSGDAYIAESFGYHYSHVWRNFGIMIAFLIFFMGLYFAATEINSVPTSEGEMLVYQKGRIPPHLLKGASRGPSSGAGSDTNNTKVVGSGATKSTSGSSYATGDVENAARVGDAGEKPQAPEPAADNEVHGIPPQKDIFTWKNVVYDIEVKGKERRLLDHVSGWVKPGTLTALMGVSGAGKTTLLDVLAERTTMGVITGDMFVNGSPRGTNFQRNTGYVQQQDLHLETATVRESLRFSAMLRQPKTVSKQEKYAFVEEVIQMLNMEDFADAVVGVPGEGLNVEQRKLLTIGVELAAKPKLLLFLDEPTSGLDSQSSWAICNFLRKLADAGQAVLCTIHQPSAVLFEQFDRLLFLAAGGKTVYFGEVGHDSRTLLDYFEAKGARACGSTENPAEYMLEIVNKTVAGDGQDWHATWNASAERVAVESEIERIYVEKRNVSSAADKEPDSDSEFAMPFSTQLWEVTYRIFQQYWRMPSYIFAKLSLGILAGLFVGFSFFQAKGTLAGTQSVIFSVFQILTIFSSLVQQIMPLFVTQRSLYEVRERPGKMYSWKAFIIANIVVEFPWQILTGIVTYACFYYPVIGVQAAQRQGLVLLFVIQLMLYASSFATMCIAALPDAQTAGGIVTLLVMTSLIFSGVLQTPVALPGFWIFMYRVSPFTYWVSGVISTAVHDRPIVCSAAETSIFSPPMGYTCGQYLAPYLTVAPGTLQNPDDTADCRYCQISVADTYLAQSNIYWSTRWRNFGILWAYILFNIFIAILTYYLFRVRRVSLSLSSLSSLKFWGKKKKAAEAV